MLGGNTIMCLEKTHFYFSQPSQIVREDTSKCPLATLCLTPNRRCQSLILVLVHRHLELSRHTSPLLEPKGSSWSWLVSGVHVFIAINCCLCSGRSYTVTDIRQTYQLGQFTGCLLSHRPIITKDNIKLHPPHCAHFLRHEVMLCRVVQPSWLARLALPAAAGPEIYLGYRAGKTLPLGLIIP